MLQDYRMALMRLQRQVQYRLLEHHQWPTGVKDPTHIL